MFKIIWKVKRVREVMWKMHKLIFPGEYGLGETGDDKQDWEELGRLWEELYTLIFR